MKLFKFRIRNYKSIKDSGNCYVETGITILAGKNEAGKTAILEALEDFNTAKPIRDKAKPPFSPDAVPEVTLVFKFNEEELNKLRNASGLENSNFRDREIEIVKTYPDIYKIQEKSLKEIFSEKEIGDNSFVQEKNKSLTQIYENITKTLSKYPLAAGEQVLPLTTPYLNLRP